MISLCKYVPHKFEWQYLDGKQSVKGQGKKQAQVLASTVDVRKYPFLIKDGDIVGFRIEKENLNGKDDFQTDQDIIDKAEFQEKQQKHWTYPCTDFNSVLNKVQWVFLFLSQTSGKTRQLDFRTFS